MATATRFDLKIDADEKAIVAKAAALMGATMAGFVRLAAQHRRRGISSVYVLAESAQPERILGYYTLSAAEVDGQRLAEAGRKKLPRYPVACFRATRLGTRSAAGARTSPSGPDSCRIKSY